MVYVGLTRGVQRGLRVGQLKETQLETSSTPNQLFALTEENRLKYLSKISGVSNFPPFCVLYLFGIIKYMTSTILSRGSYSWWKPHTDVIFV